MLFFQAFQILIALSLQNHLQSIHIAYLLVFQNNQSFTIYGIILGDLNGCDLATRLLIMASLSAL